MYRCRAKQGQQPPWWRLKNWALHHCFLPVYRDQLLDNAIYFKDKDGHHQSACAQYDDFLMEVFEVTNLMTGLLEDLICLKAANEVVAFLEGRQDERQRLIQAVRLCQRGIGDYLDPFFIKLVNQLP